MFQWAQSLPVVNGGVEQQPQAPKGAQKGGGRPSKRGRQGKGGERVGDSADAKMLNMDEMQLEEMDVTTIQKLFPVICKLILNNSLRIRQMEAVAIRVVMCSSGMKPIVMAKARVKAWVETATDIRKKGSDVEQNLAKLGHISLAAMAGLLEGLNAEGEAVGRANATALTELCNKLNAMDRKQLLNSVVMVKVANAYKEGDAKLLLSLKGLDEECIINALTQLGGKHLVGMAPMGHLERVIHTQLAQWEED
mmetsp:Transcript_102335/g.289382  ORF Transcript_102335/g.289382 Transcript_102335/m.289382 type:complete len:251 (+) Transcript_102335:109-861(+)